MTFDMALFNPEVNDEDIQKKIAQPVQAIALAIEQTWPGDTDHITLRSTLRKLLWARNQLWYSFNRTNGYTLGDADCSGLLATLSEVDSTTDVLRTITKAISDFIQQLDSNITNRVDKLYGYNYLVGVRADVIKVLKGEA